MLFIFRTRWCPLIVIGIFCWAFSSTAAAQKATITIVCDEAGRATNVADKKNANKKPKPSEAVPRLVLPEKTVTPKPEETSSLTFLTILLGCNATASVRVEGGPPNQTIVYSMIQTNSNNILGFKWNLADPVTPSIEVPVQLNATGFGISNTFYIKALFVGQTITYGQSGAGWLTTSAEITVSACDCPTIQISLPPRN